jgi:uncharacterized protein (DUF433 family)
MHMGLQHKQTMANNMSIEREERLNNYAEPEPIQHIRIVDGRAKIRGYKARIVAQMYLNGATMDFMTTEFDLTPAEIYAAVSYYYDNQQLIEQRETDMLEKYAGKIQESREHLAQIRARHEARQTESSQE